MVTCALSFFTSLISATAPIALAARAAILDAACRLRMHGEKDIDIYGNMIFVTFHMHDFIYFTSHYRGFDSTSTSPAKRPILFSDRRDRRPLRRLPPRACGVRRPADVEYRRTAGGTLPRLKRRLLAFAMRFPARVSSRHMYQIDCTLRKMTSTSRSRGGAIVARLLLHIFPSHFPRHDAIFIS